MHGSRGRAEYSRAFGKQLSAPWDAVEQWFILSNMEWVPHAATFLCKAFFISPAWERIRLLLATGIAQHRLIEISLVLAKTGGKRARPARLAAQADRVR